MGRIDLESRWGKMDVTRRKFIEMNTALTLCAAACLLSAPNLRAQTIRLDAYPEYLRVDPFGQVVKADHRADGAPVSLNAGQRTVSLKCARGGYVSFHLLAEPGPTDSYSLDLNLISGSSGIKVDIYREWFHFLQSDKTYYPDALIPVQLPYRSRFPEPDNRINGQTAQAFWVDVWIPNSTTPGVYRARATLSSGRHRTTLSVVLNISSAIIPENDVVTMDHNSYGSNWLGSQYPALVKSNPDFYTSDAFFHLIQAYHKIFYENRGLFHQLGYGHAGKVGPEFAPVLEGTGRNRHISDWTLFDRHYSALFDGSAFAGTRRGARPLEAVYLPINPEWPAQFVNWGEPGYEEEFVNVVSEMERHFREKGWTHTRFEMFFNHKKRYMGFSWDGDEVRFPKDNHYFAEYARLMKKALPADTPVKFLLRADVSWDMEQQFHELAGLVRMWICSGGILSWYKDAPRMLRNRGDIVWFYSGPPSVSEPGDTISKFPFQAWLWGVDGFEHWLTVDPGPDPWFHFEGGGTALVYPGEKFGLEEPIPSIRLKIQRNCLQDLALLDGLKTRHSIDDLRAEAARRYNNSKLDDWWNPWPPMADTPSSEWAGTSIDDATKGTSRMLDAIGSDAWAHVHNYVMQMTSEGL